MRSGRYIFGIALEVVGVLTAIFEWNDGLLRSVGIIAMMAGATVVGAERARNRKRVHGFSKETRPLMFGSRWVRSASVVGALALAASIVLVVMMSRLPKNAHKEEWLMFAFFASSCALILVVGYFLAWILSKFASRS